MNTDHIFLSLERFPDLLSRSVDGLSDADARWRPPDNAWSILEVAAHLADEEQFDFKVRLKSTLEDPAQPWPEIDPVGWAASKNYNSGRLQNALERFTAERKHSLDWLHALQNPDWSRAHQHPKFGPIRAGDLLAAWAAHDLFHLRQIAKRRIQLLESAAAPHSIAYAGGSC